MVDIIPKKTQIVLPWQNVILYISVAVLIGVVLSYVLLIYSENKKAVILEDLAGQITAVGSSEDKLLEQEVLDAKKKIEDFSDLLAERRKTADFFSKFEKLCHPDVWFSDFSLNLPDMNLTVSGRALSPKSLEQQLSIFKKEPTIQQTDLSELKLGEGGDVEFSLLISFKSEMFAK